MNRRRFRTIPVSLLVVCALLVVPGCSIADRVVDLAQGSSRGEEESVQEETDEQGTGEPSDAGGGEDEQSTPGQSPSEGTSGDEQNGDETPSPSDFPQAIEDAGFLPKDLGEKGAFPALDENGRPTDEYSFELTLLDIQDPYECVKEMEPPDGDHYARLEFDLDVLTDYSAENPGVRFDPETDLIVAFDENGTLLSRGKGISGYDMASPYCTLEHYDDGLEPSILPPGSDRGYIVIDVPEDAAYIGYSSYWVGAVDEDAEIWGGWAWALPRR